MACHECASSRGTLRLIATKEATANSGSGWISRHEATDAESGLEAIQASEDNLVVLFNITLHKNAMTGADGIILLGAAACNVRLARQHAFIVITPTQDQVEAALGHMLHYLAIPVLAEPVDMDVVTHTVDEMGSRLLVSA